MNDVTALVRRWICCSNDLWLRWFSSTDRGPNDYPIIDLLLLKVIVLDDDDLVSMDLSPGEFFQRLHVVYPAGLSEVRQFCSVQRAGNIFCKSSKISIAEGRVMKVRSIDVMGTMNDGRSYVEVVYDGGYILESPESVGFVLM